jgi:predicted ATPase
MLNALLNSPGSVTSAEGGKPQKSAVFNVAGQIQATDIEGLKPLIVERIEANPFFMEEMVQALFEQGALVADPVVRLARPLTEIMIPTSVQAVLASRIDRLPADHKELLQTLAVLGREFSFMLVQRVTGKSNDELEAMLSRLEAAEFIYEHATANDIEFTFKHALTQEVAYNSVLVERRKQIHERGAQAIESLFASRLPDYYETLARHYRRSGNAIKAADYLYLAAQRAMNPSGYAEAKVQLESALDLIRTRPDDPEHSRIEIRLLISLAMCSRVSTSGGLFATEPVDILEHARELSANVGDDVLRCEILEALALQYGDRLEHQEARAICEELLAIAIRMGDPQVEARARAGLGVTSMRQGSPLAALEEFERVDALATGALSGREAALGSWRILNRSFAPRVLWYVGYPERAAIRNREWIAAARNISPIAFAWALFGSFFLNMLLRDPKSTRSAADEAMRLLDEQGIISMLPYIGFQHGWAVAQSGQLQEGLAEMLRCRAGLMHTASPAFNPWFNLILAEVYLAAGRPDEGLEAANEGLQLGQRTGTRHLEAEMHRLKGELLLVEGSTPIADISECFLKAIDVARRQNAKSWELRATMSSARLLAKQGRELEARDMLAQIYGWFTEGFDTADLKDARALLDELRG